MKLCTHYLWLLLAMLASATACNRDQPAEQQADTTVVAPLLRDTVAADTFKKLPIGKVEVVVPSGEVPTAPPATAKELPKEQPKQEQKPSPKPPTPQQETPPATTPDKPAADTFSEGTYGLQSVQGEALPLVLDMTTECDVKLMNGILTLRNGNFQFQSNTAEVCSGSIRSREKHEASGTYKITDKQIFLSVRYGDALGDARGVVEGNRIRLLEIGNEEEQQQVNWLFQLQ